MEGLVIYQRLLKAEEAQEFYTELLHWSDTALPIAERMYQTVKHDVTIELRRTHGATIAREVVRGDERVAWARMLRDEIRNTRQTANKELARLTSLHLRLRDDMNREYSRPSNR
jgi:hypothetical protein